MILREIEGFLRSLKATAQKFFWFSVRMKCSDATCTSLGLIFTPAVSTLNESLSFRDISRHFNMVRFAVMSGTQQSFSKNILDGIAETSCGF